jgi:hypothetical protein
MTPLESHGCPFVCASVAGQYAAASPASSLGGREPDA